MKKILLVISILLLPIALFSNDEKVYKVVIRKDWKPYYFINENGKPDGFAIELFDKVAKKQILNMNILLLMILNR